MNIYLPFVLVLANSLGITDAKPERSQQWWNVHQGEAVAQATSCKRMAAMTAFSDVNCWRAWHSTSSGDRKAI